MPSRRQSGQSRVKTLQLCRQVQRILQVEFGCCDCDVIQSLQVCEVAPMAGAGQLMVSVAPMLPDDARPMAEIYEALERSSGRLRTEVAQAIHRRKAPTLFFQVAPPTASESS